MAANNKLNLFFSFTTLFFVILVAGQDLGPISNDDGFIAESPDQIPLLEIEAAEAPETSDIPRDIDVGFLKSCVESSTAKCGKEVYNALFTDLAVGDECCLQLYYILGKPCHDGFVKAVLARPENKDSAAKVLPKSKLVWDMCALLATSDEFGSPAPGINVFEDTNEDLLPF